MKLFDEAHDEEQRPVAAAVRRAGTIDELGRALPALPPTSGIGNLFSGI